MFCDHETPHDEKQHQRKNIYIYTHNEEHWHNHDCGWGTNLSAQLCSRQVPEHGNRRPELDTSVGLAADYCRCAHAHSRSRQGFQGITLSEAILHRRKPQQEGSLDTERPFLLRLARKGRWRKQTGQGGLLLNTCSKKYDFPQLTSKKAPYLKVFPI